MNARTLRILAVIAVLLAAVIFLMDSTDETGTIASGEPLIADLKTQLNDIQRLSVTAPGGEESVSIVNNGDAWVVPDRDDFPADVGKIREVLLALADAKTIERKTANPDRYSQLGVDDSGTLLSIEGEEFVHEVIIGKVAQTNYRYVRLASDEQSWLMDKNPALPDSSGGWLLADIVDIEAARIRAVSIEHGDGELIRLSKAAAEDTNYAVLEIPEDRELSYPTVANGIAGALSTLRLEDVKDGDIADDAVLTTFETFDGLQVSVRSEDSDGDIWITLIASANGDAAAEAEAINQRVAGWLYKIPEFKANMLRRHWTDILKSESEE